MKIIQGALALLVLGRAAAADGDAPSRLRVPGHSSQHTAMAVSDALPSEVEQVLLKEEAAFGVLRDGYGSMSMPDEPDEPDDCVPVNHQYDQPGEVTCDCVSSDDPCFSMWDENGPECIPDESCEGHMPDEPDDDHEEDYDHEEDDVCGKNDGCAGCAFDGKGRVVAGRDCFWNGNECFRNDDLSHCQLDMPDEPDDDHEEEYDYEEDNDHEEDDDHEECEWHEEECEDGMCVLLGTGTFLGACPEHCGILKKKCEDGECIGFMKKCPEEHCGWHQKDCGDGTCVGGWGLLGRCPGEDFDLKTE